MPIRWRDLIPLAVLALAALAVVAAIASGIISTARAHDFYDQWCCTGKDCAPALSGEVTWTPQGWAVSRTHETIPFDDKRIRYTPPGQPQFHICQVPHISTIRCLYVPEPEG